MEGFGSERRGRDLHLFGWMEMGGGEGRRNCFPSRPSKFLLPTLGGKRRDMRLKVLF